MAKTTSTKTASPQKTPTPTPKTATAKRAKAPGEKSATADDSSLREPEAVSTRAKKPAKRAAAKKATVESKPVTPTTLAKAEIVDDDDAADSGVIHPEIVGHGDLESFDADDDLDGDADSDLLPDPIETTDRAAEKSDSKALTTTDPVSVYLAEIRKYPLLTKEQEQELAIRYRETGDPKAAEALVTSNLRFVVKVAAEYSRFGAKLIDLIQEGNVGLMHAVKEFNPYKGVRLITYAVWWIRGYIQEYLMRQYSMVRIGTTQNQRKLFYRLQKEREALGALGQEPTYALLAGRLGVTEEEVETMSKRLAGRDVSLNQPIDSSSTTAASLLDFEPSEAPAVDETLGRMEEMQVLRENLDKIRDELSEKEHYLLENRLLSDEPMTLQEIGDHFGVTREAVRQLEARLLGKIRTAVTKSLEGEVDGEDEE